ncbi:MAG: DUF2975 domain-containing protein [Gammaproteobacteria bacterium]|nr:DUF2975 domain-containing protein [Gammaproteobacteria bacterium]
MQQRIQTVSKLFRWFFQICFIVAPILTIAAWVSAPHALIFIKEKTGIAINAIPKDIMVLYQYMPVSTKILGFLVSLIPLSVNLLILYCLISLFKLFEKAEIFSKNTVRYIRNIGWLMLIGQVASLVYQALITLVVSWPNGHGHRFVALSMNQANIGVILTAILIILVSWIMAEAHQLQEQQKYTV